jgi:GNAT superfamily N-acetyltransferase
VAVTLDEVGHRLWVAPEVEDHDGWLLRAANGLTGRANSVLPLRAGARPLAQKIAAAERWYAERDLPARFQLSPASLPDGIDDELAARGYRIPQPPVSVETATLQANEPDERVVLAAAPDDEWIALWGGSRGFDDAATMRALLTGSLGSTVFARIDGSSIGRAVAHDGWLGITSMLTAPASRRKGFGRAVLTTLLAWGRARECERALLQVESTNKPARALYAAFGFAEHHAYHYRLAP